MPVGQQGLPPGSGFVSPMQAVVLVFTPTPCCPQLGPGHVAGVKAARGWGCSLHRFPTLPPAHLPTATERATKTSRGELLWSCFFKKTAPRYVGFLLKL